MQRSSLTRRSWGSCPLLVLGRTGADTDLGAWHSRPFMTRTPAKMSGSFSTSPDLPSSGLERTTHQFATMRLLHGARPCPRCFLCPPGHIHPGVCQDPLLPAACSFSGTFLTLHRRVTHCLFCKSPVPHALAWQDSATLLMALCLMGV